MPEDLVPRVAVHLSPPPWRRLLCASPCGYAMAPKRKIAGGVKNPIKKKTKVEEVESPEKTEPPTPPSDKVKFINAVLEKYDEVSQDGLLPWLLDRIAKQGTRGYCEYYDATYPPQVAVDYLRARDVAAIPEGSEGTPCRVRLVQLAVDPMSGNAGVVEIPTMRTLLGRVLEVGLQTDADTCQGTERLASRLATDKEHSGPVKMVHPYGERRSNPLAPAFGLFHTKGWKRSVAGHLVVALVQELGLEHQVPDEVKMSLATVHSVVCRVKDLRDSVEKARSITTASTSTRRPVNCFNHLHMLRLLKVEGKTGAEELEQGWNQKQIQSLFKIGPTEASAAKNLAFDTTPYMVEVLTKLAEEFGMHSRYGPLQHVALASRWLCPGGMPLGLGAQWQAVLTNTDMTVNLLADKISTTWRSAPKAFRKTLSLEARRVK